MSSNTITPRPDSDTARSNRESIHEAAPSFMHEDEPKFARWAGTFGAMVVMLGVMILIVSAMGRRGMLLGVIGVGPGWGSFLLFLGLICLLLHAAVDKDLQIRRFYGAFGILWLVAGIALSLWYYQGSVGGLFGFGFPCLVLALLFLLSSLRNETDETWRNRAINVVGVAGGIMALAGFIGGNIGEGEFLQPYGFLLSLLGLGYLWAFVGLRGADSDTGYRVSQVMGAAGLLVFAVALGRSALPPLFFSWRWLSTPPTPYLVPTGLLLMGLGFLYLAMAAGMASDRPLIVLTRRELAGFFYSPIGYLILIGLTFVAWYFFWFTFLDELMIRSIGLPGRRVSPMLEPIVQRFMFGLFPAICMIFVVPVLTMRLLSEEKRTGTLEVLLTAPVNEIAVVLSKFLAALIFLLVTWAPWGLFLVALRVEVGKPFDYRPLLSFFIALAFMGSGFVGMGVFFSSLTRNQIVSAVLTFAGMILFLGISITKWNVEDNSPGSPWVVVLNHISFVDLWLESLRGALVPRYLLYHLTAAVLWLFMTVKVLEARKWS